MCVSQCVCPATSVLLGKHLYTLIISCPGSSRDSCVWLSHHSWIRLISVAFYMYTINMQFTLTSYLRHSFLSDTLRGFPALFLTQIFLTRLHYLLRYVSLSLSSLSFSLLYLSRACSAVSSHHPPVHVYMSVCVYVCVCAVCVTLISGRIRALTY
jgi:hypothetical protein